MSGRIIALLLASVGFVQPYVLPNRETRSIVDVTESDWQSLNGSVGGRLFAGKPLAHPCYSSYQNASGLEHDSPDLAACLRTATHKADPSFLTDQFGAYLNGHFGTCMSSGAGCPLRTNILPLDPISPLLGTCHQGSVPDYYIDVQEVSDIQRGLDFARSQGIPLVIKNSGHDYKGRSSGPNSLALWTHNLRPPIRIDEQFTPDSCSESVGPTFTYGAGQDFEGLYSFAAEHGYMMVGGICSTVGASGGWITGGGHSALSPTYGLGVDNAMQMKVVLPNGTHITANRCQNQDVFFALRGGGGGTFGVVTETTSRVYPQVPLQMATIAVASLLGEKGLSDVLVQNAAQWAEDGWGGYIVSVEDNFALLTAITPKLSLEEAKESMKPLTDYAASLPAVGLSFDLGIKTIHDFRTFFDAPGNRLIEIVSNGLSNVLATRLIPRQNFEGRSNQEKLADAFPDKLTAIFMVPPVSYDVPETDKEGGPGEASVTPAWRDSLWFIIKQVAWDNSLPLMNSPSAVADKFREVSNSVQRLRELTPNGGTYQNEADTFEPDYTHSFWGKNYDRLLSLKHELDPDNLLTCHQCIGWDSKDTRYSCYSQI